MGVIVHLLDPAPRKRGREGGREGGRGEGRTVSMRFLSYISVDTHPVLPPSLPPSLPPYLPEVARVPREAVNEEFGLPVCLLHGRPVVEGGREGGMEG